MRNIREPEIYEHPARDAWQEAARVTLRPCASPHAETAEEWWDSLGYVSVGGGAAHPVCAMSEISTFEPSSEDERECLQYGIDALDAAESVADALAQAIAAHARGDFAATIAALKLASAVENEYGDDPATQDLGRQLLGYLD